MVLGPQARRGAEVGAGDHAGGGPDGGCAEEGRGGGASGGDAEEVHFVRLRGTENLFRDG